MDFIKQTLNQVDMKDSALYNIVYDLYFYAALRESKDDIKNGRVFTLEEVDNEMEELYENHTYKKSQNG